MNRTPEPLIDERASLRFANACGAIKCTQAGPRLRASEEEVARFLEVKGNDRT